MTKERALPAVRNQRRGTYALQNESFPSRDIQPAQPSTRPAQSYSQDTVSHSQDARIRNDQPMEVDARGGKRMRFALPDGPQKLERVIRGTLRSGKLASLVLQAPVGGSEDLTVEDVLTGSVETRQLIFNKKMWEQGDEGRIVLAPPSTAQQTAKTTAAASIFSVGAGHFMAALPSQSSSGPLPIFPVEVAGQEVLALYDTGSNCKYCEPASYRQAKSQSQRDSGDLSDGI